MNRPHGQQTQSNLAERLQQAAVVEPVDPLDRREFDAVDVAPRAAAANDLGLVEANDGLNEGVVVNLAMVAGLT